MWTHLETFSQIYTPTFPIKRGNLLFNTSKLKVHSYTGIICLHQISQKTSGPNEQQDAKHLLFFSRLKCPLRHEGQTARLLYNSAVLCLEDKIVQLWPPYDRGQWAARTSVSWSEWHPPTQLMLWMHLLCSTAFALAFQRRRTRWQPCLIFSRSVRQLMYCNDINTYNK